MGKQTSTNFIRFDWQLEFAECFFGDKKRRSRIVAATGMGKSSVARYIAQEAISNKSSDYVLVITTYNTIARFWQELKNADEIILVGSKKELLEGGWISVTSNSIKFTDYGNNILRLGKNFNFLIIIDEAHSANSELMLYVEEMLKINAESRTLEIYVPIQAAIESAWNAKFDREYIFQPEAIELPETKIEIARFSPSFAILQSILLENKQIDNIGWRQFEKLIAELLEADGYTVTLMQGSKDGGVDVIAVKDLGPLGEFKTLWQAKKKKAGNKVGLSVVRELADTRNEFGASKAFIVTSTYLTRDAIERIRRDCYRLGKVDRDDLDIWINNVFRSGASR